LGWLVGRQVGRRVGIGEGRGEDEVGMVIQLLRDWPQRLGMCD